jgi:hypothetical protein
MTMLENTLTQLINKTEKDWGYLQVHKRGEFYSINILGNSDPILKFKSNESTNQYRLFWYKRSEPSVFVQSKTTKNYNRATRMYDKYKTYQVCCKVEANSVETGINQLFAELVKAKITQRQSQGDTPIVSVVRQ